MYQRILYLAHVEEIADLINVMFFLLVCIASNLHSDLQGETVLTQNSGRPFLS